MSHHTINRATTVPVAQEANTRFPRWTFITAGIVRILIGFMFFWAFIDKMFGLGISTQSGMSVLTGGSPTTGYLTNAVPENNPFRALWDALVAINPITDVLFMAGLLGIGVALILGIGMKVAVWSGAAMYIFMAAASLPFATNPIVDDHVLMALVLVVLLGLKAQDHVGLGRAWAGKVGENSWLR